MLIGWLQTPIWMWFFSRIVLPGIGSGVSLGELLAASGQNARLNQERSGLERIAAQ
jgi:hypothetical protein